MDDRWYSYLNVVGMLAFVVFTPFSIWIIQKYGVRTSLILALGLQVLGGAMRLFMDTNFMYCVIGQSIFSIGGPIIVNMTSKVSAMWFPKEERVAATMTSLIFGLVGWMVALFLQILLTDSVPITKYFDIR